MKTSIGLALGAFLGLSSNLAKADEVPVLPPPAVSAPALPEPVVPFSTPPASSAVVPVKPSSDDAADLARFQRYLYEAERPAHTYRIAGGVTGLVLSAGLTPTGALLMKRSNAGAFVFGAGIGAGIGGLLVLSGLGLGELPHAKAERAVAQAKARGLGPREALEAGENELHDAAKSARTARIVGGGLLLGISALTIGTGAVFAGADFTGRSFTRQDQDNVAVVLLTAGAFSAIGSIQTMIFPTPIETMWDGYSAGKRRSTQAPKLVGAGFAPLPEGGATLGLSGQF
jgi:hypothetical protein